MQGDSGSVRNLVIGILLVAVPFAAAYLLTKDNDNSQILLIIAITCVGLALAFAFASGLQGLGGLVLRLSGRSGRDIFVLGLALLSLLTPWSIELTMGHLPRIFGWNNPLAWVLLVALIISVMESAGAYQAPALAAGGVALAVWVGWAAWVLRTPALTSLNFSFTPVDLLSTGWYAGLIGFLVAVDGFASRRAKEPGLASFKQVWPFTLVPGMGLVRMGFSARGRGWLAAAALVLAFLGISAINDSEFAYWAHFNSMPPDRGRFDVLAAAVTLGLVTVLSWFDTWRSFRRREVLGDWLESITERSRSERS